MMILYQAFLSEYVWHADNMGEDCPVFDNLFEFCQIYAGGTIGECQTSIVQANPQPMYTSTLLKGV